MSRNIVFVIDDDLAVRESLKFALELEGMTVHACGSGAELLADAALPRAGCLVLDEKMPGMDGFEILRHLVALEIGPPIILITGQANADLRRRAKAAGVRQVLEKPLLDGTLIDCVRDILALSC